MPMNPEWLPVLGLLLAGIFAAFLTVRALRSRRGQDAVMFGVGSLGAIALALAIGRPEFPPDKVWPLTPGPASDEANVEEPDTTSTSLVLGAVTLRVPAAKRYDLALDGERFLRLETTRKGLVFTCDAGSDSGRIFVHIRENRFVYPTRHLGHRNRPDDHTFAVQKGDSTDIFRVRYANPRRIEIMGEFYPRGPAAAVTFRDRGGILWPGGGAPPHTTVDLRHFGKGTIVFEKSGLVRVKR